MKSESAVQACLREMGTLVSGELRTDEYSRLFYSTDASIYRVQPHAVLIPRNREDVQAAVETAARYDVAILARASGSSLAGQTVNEAIVIDFTRHLDGILEINQEEKSVRVEPGVILGTLNQRLRPMGLKFGPDPASADRAAIGGIVSNNATGAHSILYGMTADHVQSMNVILSDGSRAWFGPDGAVAGARNGLHSRISSGLNDIVSDSVFQHVLREHTPRHWRRCGGYNLDRLVPGSASYRIPQSGQINLAKLVSGAEGTLAVIEDVTLGLVDIPRAAALAVVHFDDLHTALSAVTTILETDPSAVELLDKLGMEMCRKVPQWRRKLEGFTDGVPECVLITEYYGESAVEVKGRIENLRTHLSRSHCGAGTIVEVLDPDLQAHVWSVRKMGLGFLMSVKGDHKPIPFIEDAAVPPEHLADYVTGVEKFCQGIGTKVAYYAHASAGCIHIRPLINTKSAREIALLPEITSFAIEQLKGFGGALSSEHGDGRARSAFNEQFFGRDLYGLYKSVKNIFDPDNILNPGNIVDAGPMTENLRFGPEYSTEAFETELDFSADNGFASAVEMCNGAGVCRKLSVGVMCPSFRATREEEHSTRGRANALRAILASNLEGLNIGDRRLFETMDLCLECKACASECPSSVDMARLKVEFLAQYHRRHGVPLRSRLFAGAPSLARRASGRMAPVINLAFKSSPVRWIVEMVTGITRHRVPPPYARHSFLAWNRGRSSGVGREDQFPGGFSTADRSPGAATAPEDRRSSAPGRNGRVVLFNDTFNTYHYPQVGIAAMLFLEAAGFDVVLPGHRCCGRPALSKGLVARARQSALETVDILAPLAEEGLPIIGLEPSCLLTFKDEYAYLLPDDPRVALIADRAVMFEDFVADLAARGALDIDFTSDSVDVLLHGHCHQKALGGTDASRAALSLPPNYCVKEIPSGCCGMAGSFGFEKEHYDLSMTIGEDVLLPAAREAAPDTIIAASGVSCRQQIEHGAGRIVLHPAEILFAALSTRSGSD